MRREFFDGISDDEDKAVKAFVSQNSESALKTKPKVRASFITYSLLLQEKRPSVSYSHIPDKMNYLLSKRKSASGKGPEAVDTTVTSFGRVSLWGIREILLYRTLSSVWLCSSLNKERLEDNEALFESRKP